MAMTVSSLWPADSLDTHFHFLPRNRVIICKKCKFAVVPNHIRSHLQLRHRDLDAATKKALAAAVDRLGSCLARFPAEVVYPNPEDPPIACLPVFHLALSCRGKQADGQTCKYVCLSSNVMHRHCLEVHAWDNPRRGIGRPSLQTIAAMNLTKMWEEHGRCQKFFAAGGWQKYFRVSSGIDGSSKADPKLRAATSQKLHREYVKGEIMAAVDATKAARQQELNYSQEDDSACGPGVSPWLEMTRWTRYVKTHNFTELTGLAFLPDCEREPALYAITDSLDRVVERAYESICQDKINVFDQTRINSFMQRVRAFDRPLMVKLQKTSYKAYKQVWKRLICFAYRSTLPSCSVGLAHKLTPKQQVSLDRLLLRAEAVREAATSQDSDSVRDDAGHESRGRCDGADLSTRKQELDRECLIFCISLLDHTLKGDIYESVVVGFLAILGIDIKAQTFMGAYAYTPTLSKFIKISQMLVAQRAVLAVEEGEADDPADLLDDMRDRFLVHGSRSSHSHAEFNPPLKSNLPLSFCLDLS